LLAHVAPNDVKFSCHVISSFAGCYLQNESMPHPVSISSHRTLHSNPRDAVHNLN